MGSFVTGPGYRIYAARPVAPDSVRVRGVAQLEDGQTYMLDDVGGVSSFAATGVADPLIIGYLAALYADAQDYPRRVLDTGDLSRAVNTGSAGEAVVTVHTARFD